MAQFRKLQVCNLVKEGFCHIVKAGPMIDTIGIVGGATCTGKVCEDFEYKYICGHYPIVKKA